MTVGRLPALNGFDPPDHLEVSWDDKGTHFAGAYRSPDGELIVVSHESGPELFFLILGGAAAATTLIRGAHEFMQWVRAHRLQNGAPPEVVNAEPLQFWFYEKGNLRRTEVLKRPEGD